MAREARDAWTTEEVEAVVADYFAMLAAEIAGKSYSKTDHRRRLLSLLRRRSEQSIEFKHANISAVLIELGFPYIAGYKPRSNYQRLLYEVVSRRLSSNPELLHLAAVDVERPVNAPMVSDILQALTAPPKPSTRSEHRVADRKSTYLPAPVNYLEREARNRALGEAGEEFVINFERARLIKLGCETLASKIEHVAKTKGDAEGFDILSYERSGRERLIEVKTTKYGPYTPFFVSRNEVQISKAHAKQYHLYRVYAFRNDPRLFSLHGALSRTCDLDPATYIATIA
jgi:hypothetical protein